VDAAERREKLIEELADAARMYEDDEGGQGHEHYLRGIHALDLAGDLDLISRWERDRLAVALKKKETDPSKLRRLLDR